MAVSSAGALLLIFCIVGSCIGRKFFLVVPNELYYDTNTVAVVTAHDTYGFYPGFGLVSSVQLEYRGVKNKNLILNSTTLNFRSDESQSWTVVFPWERLRQLGEKEIDIVMSSEFHEEKKRLSFATNFGFIFIQTDKPVYTPQQTVKFRVIALDENQKLAKYIIRIDVRDHKQIVVDRKRITADEAFKTQIIELPKETEPGEWSITASFEGAEPLPGESHTRRFQVKEYVLPRFFTDVEIQPKIITNKTEKIEITVTAKYVYGQNLFGTASIKIGTWNKTHGIKLFPKNYTQQLLNGSFALKLELRDVLADIKHNGDNRLYVIADVTESSTLEVVSFEDTSTIIGDSIRFSSINFRSSKNYFKPGYNYTLQLQVTEHGRPIKEANLNVTAFITSNEGQREIDERNVTCNNLGEMTQEYMVPENTNSLFFHVNLKIGTEIRYFPFSIYRLYSPNEKYIHISLSSDIKKDKPMIVKLNYAKSFRIKPEIITVLVATKGRIVYTANAKMVPEGQSSMQLPENLYAEVAPRMTIIAYYYVNDREEEYIMDYLVVKINNTCFEEITLKSTELPIYKPKDDYNLEIYGGPNMRVGLVAVDNAVLNLNKSQILTQDQVFEQLARDNKRTVISDTGTMEDILSSAGLLYMSLDLRPKFARSSSDSMGSPVGHYEVSSIEKHLALAELPRQSSGNHARGLKSTIDDHPQPQSVRNYFPESWLFDEIKLNSSGSMNLNCRLPDSITTWSFLAVGLSSDRGVCMSEPLKQGVSTLFFADVRIPYKVKRLEEVRIKIAMYNYGRDELKIEGLVIGSEGLCFSANSPRGSDQRRINFTIPRLPAKQSIVEIVKVM